MAGAFNQFATGIGNTDAGFVMGTGKLLLKVPETMHFRLEGKLQPGVMAKDIILHCIGEIGFDGATYRAMQFDGAGAAALTMDDRMTIANMAIEAGGKNGIFEFDAQDAGLRGRPLQAQRHEDRLTSRSSATRMRSSFTNTSWILTKLEPTVACHPDPGQRKKAKEMGDIKLDRAYVGSCTGGKTSDFLEFARVLRGKRVAIDTFGVPATPEIVHDLQTRALGRADDLGHPRRRRRADDGERRLRRVPRRAGGHVWPHQRAAQVHQRHEPQFPRPHGRQGIAGVPRLAGDRGRQRAYRQDHRPARIFELNRSADALVRVRVRCAEDGRTPAWFSPSPGIARRLVPLLWWHF